MIGDNEINRNTRGLSSVVLYSNSSALRLLRFVYSFIFLHTIRMTIIF